MSDEYLGCATATVISVVNNYIISRNLVICLMRERNGEDDDTWWEIRLEK